jgi:hypothetical protein
VSAQAHGCAVGHTPALAARLLRERGVVVCRAPERQRFGVKQVVALAQLLGAAEVVALGVVRLQDGQRRPGDPQRGAVERLQPEDDLQRGGVRAGPGGGLLPVRGEDVQRDRAAGAAGGDEDQRVLAAVAGDVDEATARVDDRG